MKTFRFKAFISYSHKDGKWSSWLQKALESYRVPRRLVGKKGQFGTIPRRLTPVFRDREDLSSASDLTSKVRECLEDSEAQIVICSPAAAQSRWVNEEIQHFKSLGREEKVFALIVDGDPKTEDPGQQCFPSAITVSSDGTACEPLGADARKWADGKHLAKLKIVSGILGIRLDELRRRDMQRRRRNWTITALSAITMLLVTGSLLFTTLTSQKEARLQRSNTEDLLSYMLGNLKQLDPIVGLEVVDQEDQQLLGYLRTLGFDELTNDQLAEKGLEWREQGQESFDRGELDDAMEVFQWSRAAFIEVRQREGSTTRAMFELGQAEFWVGYVHFERGELDEAEERFTRYGALTRRLVDANPNDAEMVMELSYTLTNMGALENARTAPDSDKALRLMQSGVQYNQIALVLDPENRVYRKDLRGSLAFLADAWLDSCDLGKAIDFRQQAVNLSRELFRESPESDDLKQDLAFSLTGLASVQQRIPVTDQALANLQEAHGILDELAKRDLRNSRMRWYAMSRRQQFLEIKAWTTPPSELWPEMQAHKQEIELFLLQNRQEYFSIYLGASEFLIAYSRLAQRLDKTVEADQALAEATDMLSSLVKEKSENRSAVHKLAGAWLEYWERHGVLPDDESVAMLASYLVEPEKVTSCGDASLAARLEVMRGNISLAKHYTSYLLNKGFYEPGFVDFCRRHELCANIEG